MKSSLEEREKHVMNTLTGRHVAVRSTGKERKVPKNPRDQEVEAALDLGAVDEAVDVAGVHSLPVLRTGAFAHCTDRTKRYR